MIVNRRLPRAAASVALALSLAAAIPAAGQDTAPSTPNAASDRPVPTPPKKPKAMTPETPDKDAGGVKDNAAAAQDKPKLTAAEAVAKANAYFDSAKVMSADFVQISPDGARSEGTLHVVRPGKMLFHYNPPSPLEIVADGRSVAVRDQNLGTQDLYFIAQTPLKFLLNSHIDLAKDTTIKHVDIDDNSVMIEIEDKATFGGVSDITLVFDPATFALKQWTVLDPQGFQTVVTLFDIDLVTQPDPALFHIDEAITSGGNANAKH